jgi:hypothetical protein
MLESGKLGTVASHGILELCKFQEGETSLAVAVGNATMSILGKYKWVSKAVGTVVTGSTTLATSDQKLNPHLSVANSKAFNSSILSLTSTPTLPNTDLFQILISPLRALSFLARMKVGVP